MVCLDRMHYLALLGYPVTAVRLEQAAGMCLHDTVITLKGFVILLLISHVLRLKIGAYYIMYTHLMFTVK